MGNKCCCLLKPGVTIDATLKADIAAHTNEAGYQTTPASVTHLKLEYQELKKDRDIDNMVKKFVNQGVISVPLRKVFHSWMFGNLILGPLFDDTDATARNRSMFLDYAIIEWPKTATKVSLLYYYDESNGNEVTYSYNGGNVNPINYVYKSSYQTCKTLISRGSEKIDQYNNSIIDQLGLLEVWS